MGDGGCTLGTGASAVTGASVGTETGITGECCSGMPGVSVRGLDDRFGYVMGQARVGFTINHRFGCTWGS